MAPTLTIANTQCLFAGTSRCGETPQSVWPYLYQRPDPAADAIVIALCSWCMKTASDTEIRNRLLDTGLLVMLTRTEVDEMQADVERSATGATA